MSKPLLLAILVALTVLGIALAALIHPDLWIPPAVAEIVLVCWWLGRGGPDDDPPDERRTWTPPRGGLVLPAPRHRLLTFVPRSLPAPQEDQTIALPLTADEHEGVTR